MVVRQWQVLRSLEERRQTLDELANELNVVTRTIRRDLEALEAAGFPILSERSEQDGRVRWRLLSRGVTPDRRAA